MYPSPWQDRPYSFGDRLRLVAAFLLHAWWGILLTAIVAGAGVLEYQHDPHQTAVVLGAVLAVTVLVVFCFPGRVLAWLDQ